MARRTVKVAVIGSGLAGLTAAYRLAKTPRVGDVEFEVHVFEKAASLGMDSHSVDIPLPEGASKKKRRIDVPMRSFQGGYYPQLIALYQHLGVRFREADFSYSFAQLHSSSASLQSADSTKRKITTFMIYDGASGRKGISVPSCYFPASKEGSLKLWEMVEGYLAYALGAFVLVIFALRMALHSLPIRAREDDHLSEFVTFKTRFLGTLRTPVNIRIPRRVLPIPVRPPPSTTLRQWVESLTPRSTLSRWLGLDEQWVAFATDILIPLFSAVCTASDESIWEHPVEEFLDFCYLTIGTHHYVVENGVRDVVERISSPFQQENIHLSSPIVSLVHAPSSSSSPKIDIHCPNNTIYPGFDHIIFATQANQAASILKTYLTTIPDSKPNIQPSHRELVEQQIACLETFEYARNVVVNHTDATVMPDSHQDRRDLNLMMAGPHARRSKVHGGEEWQKGPVSVVPPAFAMATHVLPGTDGVYQTTNPVVPIEEGRVLSVSRLERAVVTVRSKEALKGLWVERELDAARNEGDQKAQGEPEGTLRWGCAAVARGKLGRLQGAGAAHGEGPGVWLCGSYASGGIPLLEGCVVSARLVVEEGVWASEGVDWREQKELWAPI